MEYAVRVCTFVMDSECYTLKLFQCYNGYISEFNFTQDKLHADVQDYELCHYLWSAAVDRLIVCWIFISSKSLSELTSVYTDLLRNGVPIKNWTFLENDDRTLTWLSHKFVGTIQKNILGFCSFWQTECGMLEVTVMLKWHIR